MARPRQVARAARLPSLSLSLVRPARAVILLLTLIAALLPLTPRAAHAAPQLWLPTTPGERWKIIQGYNCGTHGSFDRFALDLVNLDGPTIGAPVRAAADGEVFIWEGRSGTLILKHGDGFFTQYTHMRDAVDATRGRAFKRGEVIGHAGDRTTRGNPHLHFMAFTADGSWARNRRTVPLSFADGYDFPASDQCSAHGGAIVVAGAELGTFADGVSFRSEAHPGGWRNADTPIVFDGPSLAGGFSVAWNSDPGGEGPSQPAGSGSAQLAEAGEGLHTLYIRGWAGDGKQTLATFGPIGFDLAPPSAPDGSAEQEIAAQAGQPVRLSWAPAADGASGVAGYRIYLGGDPEGSSDWFVTAPEVDAGPLGAGRYLLRVQPLDVAGNGGPWTTIATVVVE